MMNQNDTPDTERRAAPQADTILAICNKLQANADLAAQDSLPCYAEVMDEAGFVLTEMFPVLHELARLKAINAELLAALTHCAAQFREYERHHRLKGSDVKAERNAVLARIAEHAIAGATGDAT